MTPLASVVPVGGSAATTPNRLNYKRHTVHTSDGVALSVSEQCPTGAVDHTVVLLHGLCLTRQSWYRPAQRLCLPGIRVIAYDHRGHGRSDSAAPSTYTPDRLAQDLADVLVALQVRSPVTLAGHSMGGMTALTYLSLAHRPIEPVGLVLVGTAAGGLTDYGLGRLLALPGLDAAMSLASHTPRGLSARVVRGVAGPLCGIVTRDRAVSTSLAYAVRSTSASTALGFLRALKTYDRHSVLATITASTTVISGGEDLLTPTAHSDAMAAAIPGATRIHLPAAGHMLLHEAAGAVSDAILHTVTNTDVAQIPTNRLNHRATATSA